MRIRIGFSRAYSSATSAVSPATRPTMKRNWPAGGRKAEVVEDGGQRPVDVDGQGLDPDPGRRLQAEHERDAVAGQAGLARHVEEDGHARVSRVHAMARGRAGAGGAATAASTARAAASRTGIDSRRACSTPAAISSMQAEPAPPCSSPMASTPAAMAAERDRRLPEAASRAAAQEGAPAPWSATATSMASSSRRSPGAGSRDAVEQEQQYRRTRPAASTTRCRSRGSRCSSRPSSRSPCATVA